MSKRSEEVHGKLCQEIHELYVQKTGIMVIVFTRRSWKRAWRCRGFGSVISSAGLRL